MKKGLIAVLCMLLAGLCACGQVESSEETTTETPTTTVAPISVEIKPSEIAAYSEVVKAIKEEFENAPDQLNHLYYAFYDIDGNGTKELLLGVEWGGHIFLDAVYTIQNGVAVQQEAYFMDPTIGPPPLLYKNGTIRVNRVDDTIIFYYYYFRFENGELKLQIMLIDDMGRYFSNIDPMKRTPITKEEFDRVQREMEGDGQTVALDWKPLEEYGQ
ncbi:MAG: hypothetical protein FWF60_02590 [Oscillospiraceae bacterium]|nr:hypothetical protein [Oscillospiraceae bacterium]